MRTIQKIILFSLFQNNSLSQLSVFIIISFRSDICNGVFVYSIVYRVSTMCDFPYILAGDFRPKSKADLKNAVRDCAGSNGNDVNRAGNSFVNECYESLTDH